MEVLLREEGSKISSKIRKNSNRRKHFKLKRQSRMQKTSKSKEIRLLQLKKTLKMKKEISHSKKLLKLKEIKLISMTRMVLAPILKPMEPLRFKSPNLQTKTTKMLRTNRSSSRIQRMPSLQSLRVSRTVPKTNPFSPTGSAIPALKTSNSSSTSVST